MRLRFSIQLLTSFLMICIVMVGCLGFKKQTKKYTRTTTNTVESAAELVINGVVVFDTNQVVPDSVSCTVTYYDIKTNRDITNQVKNGMFFLQNLADGEYELKAVATKSGLKGSSIIKILDGRLIGRKGQDDIVRVILGIERVKEDPFPPEFFEGKVVPRGPGRIRDNF